MPVCQWWVATKIDAPGPSAARTGVAAARSSTRKIAVGPARDGMSHTVREHGVLGSDLLLTHFTTVTDREVPITSSSRQ